MAVELLSLKWNNHKDIFFNALSNIQSRGSFSDVTVACSGKYFSLHKFVLSTCSEYFHDIFMRIQSKHPVIILKDIDPLDFEALLHFIYIGEVSVAQKNLEQILMVAECLKIKGLIDSDGFLDNSTNVTNDCKDISSVKREQSPGKKRKKQSSLESVSEESQFVGSNIHMACKKKYKSFKNNSSISSLYNQRIKHSSDVPYNSCKKNSNIISHAMESMKTDSFAKNKSLKVKVEDFDPIIDANFNNNDALKNSCTKNSAPDFDLFNESVADCYSSREENQETIVDNSDAGDSPVRCHAVLSKINSEAWDTNDEDRQPFTSDSMPANLGLDEASFNDTGTAQHGIDEESFPTMEYLLNFADHNVHPLNSSASPVDVNASSLVSPPSSLIKDLSLDDIASGLNSAREAKDWKKCTRRLVELFSPNDNLVGQQRKDMTSYIHHFVHLYFTDGLTVSQIKEIVRQKYKDHNRKVKKSFS